MILWGVVKFIVVIYNRSMEFVHLHVHSDYSLLDGAASVKALADKARKSGMKHLAITDHGNMFGAPYFAAACEGDKDHPTDNPVHAIIGCEFYMAPSSRFDKKKSENDSKYYHLVLLCETTEGYFNLIKLSSLSYTEGFYYKPRIDRELLERYKTGLICLSACVAGEIPSLILEGKIEAAEKTALYFRDLFGAGNFFLEVQDHGLEVQKRSNPAIIQLAKKHGIPLVVTNDVHYIEREDSVAQDILLCMGTQAKRSDEKRMRFDSDQFYFKSAEEMAALFPEVPEAVSNTVLIAERCKAKIPTPGPLLPVFPLPEGQTDADEYLRRLTMEGLKKKVSADK
jgi:DNA polymerase-3 subunit alpha